ncbi:MAG: CBS domain-containing protein, partial [Candidatus Acidiferrales bacterium]
EQTSVRDVMETHVKYVEPQCDLEEALRLLMGQDAQHMLLVTSKEGKLEGVLTKTDILSALDTRAGNNGGEAVEE